MRSSKELSACRCLGNITEHNVFNNLAAAMLVRCSKVRMCNKVVERIAISDVNKASCLVNVTDRNAFYDLAAAMLVR